MGAVQVLWARFRQLPLWVRVALVILFVIGLGIVTQEPTDQTGTTSTTTAATAEKLRATTTTTVFPLKEPVTLTARATTIEPSTIHLEGELGVPDGALLTVQLFRAVRWEMIADEPSSVQVGNAGVRVAAGRFSHDFVVDDQRIIDTQEAEMMVPPEDRLNGLILELSSVVVVCVELRTGTENGKSIQPRDVVAAVGRKGERLATSPQKVVFGSLTDDPSNYLKTEVAVTSPSPALSQLTRIQGRRPVTTATKTGCI